MKNNVLFLLVIILIIPLGAYSQKQISGIITDKEGEGIPYALVSEIQSYRDSLITTTMSDSLGRFHISAPRDQSFLYITILGYKAKKIPFKKDETLVKITLETDSVFLKEVTITARRPIVQIKPDRIVCDLSSNPLKNDNTLEALRFVPLIQVTNENFSIIGKDQTLVYVNGRKSNLSGDALTAYIRALPAVNIRDIEVITAPNSTFRGEGNFGIINIRLKNAEYEGIRGNLSGQLWRTHYIKERGSLSLDYKKNKFTTNLSAGITNSSDWKDNSEETIYKQSQLNTVTHTLTDGNNLAFFTSLSIDYQLTQTQTIGFIVNTSLDNGNWTETGVTRFGKLNATHVDSLLDIRYKSKSHNPEVAANANYRLTFDNTRQYLFLDFDYLNNYNKQESENEMNYLDENENAFAIYQQYAQLSPQKADIWSGKIEYGNNMESFFNLKGGIDTYYSTIRNDDKYKTRQEDDFIIDSSKSNNFEINEWTSALFVHLDKNWSKKVTTSIGSRFEYTRYKGIQHTSGEEFANNYFKWLPALYIAYTPSVKHKLNYNLSYRISRPSFKSLNPFITYTSPTTYSTGNPYLKPAKRLTHNLQYLLLNHYYFTAAYSETKDIIANAQFIKKENWVESKPVNFGKDRNLRLIMNTDFNYLKRNATLNVSLSYNWAQARGEAEGVNLDYTTSYFNLYLNNYYQLSQRHQLSFDFGVDYSTKREFMNIKAPASIDVSLQLRKRIANWQFSLYSYINTCLYESKWSKKSKRIYETDELLKTTYKWGEAISFGVRIAYNFGNMKVKGVKERKTSNTEVKSRVN